MPLRDDPVSLAYYAGICTMCLVNPHQPGSPKCAQCWPLQSDRPRRKPQPAKQTKRGRTK